MTLVFFFFFSFIFLTLFNRKVYKIENEMNNLELTNILKKLDLVEDVQVNKLERETVNDFKETLRFLKNFAKFLSLYKGKEHEFVMAKDLAEISSDPKKNEDSDACIILDFKKGFLDFRRALPESVDINYSVLELFSNCLFYIINLIHNEPENVTEIYEYFADIRYCVYIFSATSIILDTKGYKNIVGVFIADLMKILTGHEFSIKRPNVLQVCNLVRKILIELAKTKTYRDLILRQILKRIKCALSYSKVNENFDGYIASRTIVFEYFLWIIKTTVNDSCDVGSNLDDNLILDMKETLEDAKKCLENKIYFVVLKLLEKILVVL